MAGLLACVLAATQGWTWREQRRALDPLDPRTTLDHVEAEVARRYRVAQMPTHVLPAHLSRSDVVLFDVRTAEEFEAGHVAGAVRVEPGIPVDAFLGTHGGQLEGKTAIFYCSVGVRSSELAARLQAHDKVPATDLYNLQGGAFRWVSDGRQLSAGTKAGRLHPYDANWGKLLARTLAPK